MVELDVFYAVPGFFSVIALFSMLRIWSFPNLFPKTRPHVSGSFGLKPAWLKMYFLRATCFGAYRGGSARVMFAAALSWTCRCLKLLSSSSLLEDACQMLSEQVVFAEKLAQRTLFHASRTYRGSANYRSPHGNTPPTSIKPSEKTCFQSLPSLLRSHGKLIDSDPALVWRF